MKDIIINGKIYSNISKLNFKNDLGEIVTFIEESEIVPEYPSTSASLFTFKNGTVTGYIGEETDVIIPRTYSIGATIIKSETITTNHELVTIAGECDYRFRFTCRNKVYEITNKDEYTSNRTSMSYLLSQYSNATIEYEAYEYVDGTDYQVTAIGENAFKNSSIQSVEIPEGVTSIGDYAFMGCTNLTNIIIPESVNYTGAGVFTSTDSLIFETYNGIKYLGNDSNPYLYLHEVIDKTATNYIIMPSTRIIGAKAFEDCSNLNNMIIPNNITCISFYAFHNCRDLNVYIPSNVIYIYSSAFAAFSGNIYCQAEAKPETWDKYWVNSSLPHNIYWGVTPEEYAELTQ